MSTAKKPGTDLAALKARLAKKTKGDAPDVPAPGQVAAVPPPGEVMPAAVPPPGEQYVPPPGEVARPPAAASPYGEYEVPPPGQQYAPPAMHTPAAAPVTHREDDPFGGSIASGFDPNAGVLDTGGDVAPRGGKGIVLFAAFLSAALGGLGGYLVNNIVSKRSLVASGKEKGAKMVEEVQRVSELRKSISIKMEDIKKQALENPKAAGEGLNEMLVEQFNKHPKIDELFGWQLASVNPIGVKKTFTLYNEANRLELELGELAGFLITFADRIQAAGRPVLFGVAGRGDNAKLVIVLQPLCGAVPEGAEGDEAKAALKPCEDTSDASGYQVQETLTQSEPSVMLRGEVQIVKPDAEIYAFAFGQEPNKNALGQLEMRLQRINERLEAMNKAEKVALKALSKYAESPDVDGTTPQPDPGDDE